MVYIETKTMEKRIKTVEQVILQFQVEESVRVRERERERWREINLNFNFAENKISVSCVN